MSKPVFLDPERRRWRRIRKSIDFAVVAVSLLFIFFVLTVVRKTSIPNLPFTDQKRNYRALKVDEHRHGPRHARRKTPLPASDVVLNSGEGIRGAFYVTWDAASFSSLREYIH